MFKDLYWTSTTSLNLYNKLAMYFIYEETEAQRAKMTYQTSHGLYMEEPEY